MSSLIKVDDIIIINKNPSDIKEDGNSIFETVCVHDPYFRYPPRYWYEKNLEKTTYNKNNLKAELINRKIKQLEIKFLNRKMNYYG